MKLLLLLIATICFYQAFSFEYGDYFADIKYCGTNILAYPFCGEVDESPIDVLEKEVYIGEDYVFCDGELEWNYDGTKTFPVEKHEHTIEVVK